jgi:predicted enzyme related to lactoylglutathione lyase
MVTDVEQAQSFYAGVFGWDFRPADPGSAYLYAYQGGRRVAGLNPITPASPMAPAWNIYLATDDADETSARVGRLGGTVLLGPAGADPAGRFVIARDPAGAQVAFWQAGGRPGLQLMERPGSPSWYELWVRDAAAADRFYGGLFDYTLTQNGDGKVVDYMTYDLGGTPRAGRFRLAGADIPAEVSARWVLYLAVADCDAAFGSAVGAGAKAVRDPADSPHGRWAILRDPWGALFAVLTRAHS